MNRFIEEAFKILHICCVYMTRFRIIQYTLLIMQKYVSLQLHEDIINKYTKYLSCEKNHNNQLSNTPNAHLNAPKKAETKLAIARQSVTSNNFCKLK